MLYDLLNWFPGWSAEELITLYESAFSAASIICACFVVGR
jgi:hypothetical protein